jgi:hypothetical protein
MVSSGVLRRVTLVRTDVSEEPDASIRVTRIGELGTTQAATSNRRMLRRVFLCSVRRLLVAACVVPSSQILVTLMEAPGSSEMSVLTRVSRRNTPEDTILHLSYCLCEMEKWLPSSELLLKPVSFLQSWVIWSTYFCITLLSLSLEMASFCLIVYLCI